MTRLAIALVVLLLALPQARAASIAIATVVRVQGTCRVTAGGSVQRLTSGASIHMGDEIATGRNGRLALALVDGTALTLGENARVVIDDFLFRAGSRSNRLRVAITGAFRFVSGGLGKAPHGDIAVATPVATIGVRGTDFWGGPIDGRYGVFLIRGVVDVTNAAGSAVLDQSGEGVNLDGPNKPPGPVTHWPTEKIGRASAAVTFQ